MLFLDASLPSPGSSGSSSPASTVLSRRCDFLAPLPPRFVAFAWRYPGCIRVSLPSRPNAAAPGRELFTRYLRPGITVETPGSPTFLGNPNCAFALLSDPGGTERIRPLQCAGTAPVLTTTKAPTLQLSRLNHTASALAVYASQWRVTPPPRKTRFRPLAKLFRTGFFPQGSTERFRGVSYISSSFPKLS